MKNIGIIIGREFNERVRKKSFIITTILMPLLMIALMAAPTLVMMYSKSDARQVLVVDESHSLADKLESDETVVFTPVEQSLTEALPQSLTDEKFGVLYIGADVMQNSSNVKLYTNSASSITVEESISDKIEQIIEREKLKEYNIDNLQQILDKVKTSVNLTTIRNDAEQGKDNQAQSSALAAVIGLVLGMILYMFLLIYGSMVMQSVIEEKNSRVLEVMVSSVKPFDMMMGKILGVASVAVLQVVIWAVLIVGMSAFILPMFTPEDVMQSAQLMQQGGVAAMDSGINPEMLAAVGMVSDIQYMATLFIYLLLFVVGGYLLYSAMFAAIGSAVDSVQDAQQLTTPVTIPIILSIIVMMTIMDNPNSQIAFWFSIIPFTSPVVMMARIPSGIPGWEIALSLVLLYATFFAMVWLSAKIYRVGIFMYGKKTSFKELWKWMRY